MKRNRLFANLRMPPQIIRCKGNNSNYAMEKPDTTLTTLTLLKITSPIRSRWTLADPVMCFSEKDTHGKLYYSLEHIT